MKWLKLRDLTWIFCLGLASCHGAHAQLIEEEFVNPPTTAQPYVWWHWMGSNISKEGITKDLEAMKAAGIGGATIFHLTSSVQEGAAPTLNNPWPEKTYRSPIWWDHMRHAGEEAKRLGLELGMHNCVGYESTGGPWVTPEKAMQRVVWSTVQVTGPAAIDQKLPRPNLPGGGGWKSEELFYNDIAVLATPEGSPIPQNAVVNLTAKMDAGGRVKWEAPAGKWTIHRFGHAATMSSPSPAPEDVRALEVDKMSAAFSREHFQHVIQPMQKELGSLVGTTYKHILLDSYEAGNQNWTADFRKQFMDRRGYDPIPWLVTLIQVDGEGDGKKKGLMLGNEDLTRRFLFDRDLTIAELFQERNFEQGAQIVRAAGMQFHMEPYGGPFDTLAASEISDVPMVEFWTGSDGAWGGNVAAAARSAGRRVIAAEAFTSKPERSKWSETPAMLKHSADGTLAQGVNRMVLHHWVHQPFGDDIQPGMGMGWWGTHFNRHQTWAKPGKAFFTYLARCQYLLQQGEPVTHYLTLGFDRGDADAISTQTFLRDLRLKNGRLTLPSGKSYAFLMLPDRDHMLPQVAQRLQELVRQGAIVMGPKPVRSPSMQNHPACDEQVRSLGQALWGATDGKNKVENKFGQGRVIWSNNPSSLLNELRLPAPANFTKGGKNVRLHHRRDGMTHLVFLANMNDHQPATGVMSVPVQGLAPEIWDAETGAIAAAGQWETAGERTEVVIHLQPGQSRFVVFRRPARGINPVTACVLEGEASTSAFAKTSPARFTLNDQGRPMLHTEAPGTYKITRASGAEQQVTVPAIPAPVPVAGPWAVRFVSPVDDPVDATFEQLASWTEHADPAIKYFSGTATYTTFLMLSPDQLGSDRRLLLDLGDVKEQAEVRVNGVSVGVAWHAPFVLDVTTALIAGRNEITIAVSNTWANRLLRDRLLPDDVKWGKARQFDGGYAGRPLLEYPQWFRKNETRPTARKTFVTWDYFEDNSPLLPAGLLGPVQLKTQITQTLP